MNSTFFFYDLETSGLSGREARVMQFAGQRTDMSLKPIGEPFNYLIRLTDDILPSPGAIFVTGITPQKTVEEGITEAEFMKIFHSEVATPGTIITGFNSVRFDDEFMRFMNYRNFYDPYEWEWKDGRSRWDLLDVARMTRALRPDGIQWPKDKDDKPTNRLELLAKANKLIHTAAHDALSDVEALIGLSKLIKDKQPKLFDYLFSVMTDKNKITEVVNSGEPFLYTSGKYESGFEKTTAVATILEHPIRKASLVFDLRYSPLDFANMSVEELTLHWQPPRDSEIVRLPIKTLQFNRCPAIAPLGVLDESSQERIKLSLKTIEENYKQLKSFKTGFSKKLLDVLDVFDEQQALKNKQNLGEPDEQLYENFLNPADKPKMKQVTDADGSTINSVKPDFKDSRLTKVLPLYKARNFPKTLSEEDRNTWDEYRNRRLLSGGENSRLQKYFLELAELSKKTNLSKNERYLLEELQLWGQSIVPNEFFE